MENVKVIALGGLGEIGKNMTVFEFRDEIIVVDCGASFPGEDMYGVDLIIPDMTYLLERQDKVKALIITHGHEDHIGAVPFFLKKLNVPVYGTKLTLGLVENKIREHGLLKTTALNVVNNRDVVELGLFSVEFLHMTHSIADACALAIKTSVGTILHTGDFKIDLTPVDGVPPDFERLGDLAKEGVLLLMSDSTNVERKGFSISESEIRETFCRLFKQASGRIIVSTFASNIHRIQQVVDVAKDVGKKVAFSGRSLDTMSRTAMSLGYLHLDEGQYVDVDEIDKFDDSEIVLVVTGSQGEPMGALSRIAFSTHRQIKIKPDDFFIVSASPIPGNDKLIGRVINELYRQQAKVIYTGLDAVHTSGHAYQDELKLMLALVRPRFFMPVHGEYRHLIHHRNLAVRMGIPLEDIIVLETGQVLELSAGQILPNGSVPTGSLLVDGIGVGDVGDIVLRDRKQLAEGGIVVVVATIDKKAKRLVSDPYVMTRGFVTIKTSEELLNQIKNISAQELKSLLNNDTFEMQVLKSRVKKAVERHVYDQTKRRPGIFPIIMVT